MNFTVIDTQAAYRRLLAVSSAKTRQELFEQELVAPFSGLANFFGMDGMSAFAQWKMTPEQFAEPQRSKMVAAVDALTAANAWVRAINALHRGKDAFASSATEIPIQDITFGLYLADLSDMPQAMGYSGFGSIPGWIITIYGEPTAYNLERVEAATIHELHHNILKASRPDSMNMMTVTVAKYIIFEGLAESFAAEQYGSNQVGPWVTAQDETTIEQAKTVIGKGLEVSGFDKVRRYIFGDPANGIPTYAGYAIGYRVVQAYLQRTRQSVVEATFQPAEIIIEESGYF